MKEPKREFFEIEHFVLSIYTINLVKLLHYKITSHSFYVPMEGVYDNVGISMKTDAEQMAVKKLVEGGLAGRVLIKRGQVIV